MLGTPTVQAPKETKFVAVLADLIEYTVCSVPPLCEKVLLDNPSNVMSLLIQQYVDMLSLAKTCTMNPALKISHCPSGHHNLNSSTFQIYVGKTHRGNVSIRFNPQASFRYFHLHVARFLCYPDIACSKIDGCQLT